MSEIKRTAQCQHRHLSGRRCAQRIAKQGLHKVCGLHREGKMCEECKAMMRAFTPPKGWKDDVHL